MIAPRGGAGGGGGGRNEDGSGGTRYRQTERLVCWRRVRPVKRCVRWKDGSATEDSASGALSCLLPPPRPLICARPTQTARAGATQGNFDRRFLAQILHRFFADFRFAQLLHTPVVCTEVAQEILLVIAHRSSEHIDTIDVFELLYVQ